MSQQSGRMALIFVFGGSHGKEGKTSTASTLSHRNKYQSLNKDFNIDFREKTIYSVC